MTRAKFRDRVKGYTEFMGAVQANTDDLLDEIINRSNDQFSIVTACLYSSASVLTIAAGTKLYNLDNVAICADRIWLAVNVTINGKPLKSFENKMGPCTVMEAAAAGFQIVIIPTPPNRWAREIPHSILFNGSFDGTETVKVHGYRKPLAINPGQAFDHNEIDLPDEYLYTAAAFAATTAMEVRSAGSQMERLEKIDARAASAMRALMAQGQMIMRSVLGYVPISTEQGEAL